MSRIAIIPARGGSKRIPRKNIHPFHGAPMIAWPIRALSESGLFDRIIVSTDDAEIAGVARAEGAEVPFLRDPALADDMTGVVPVLQDSIARLAAAGEAPDQVCLAYATGVLIRGEDVARAVAALDQTPDADYALAVTSFPFPIQRAVYQTDQGRLAMFQPEHAGTRSQDLTEAYHDTGLFCLGRTAAWAAGTPVFSDATLPIPIPRHLVQDIDTPEDLARAEALFAVLQAVG